MGMFNLHVSMSSKKPILSEGASVMSAVKEKLKAKTTKESGLYSLPGLLNPLQRSLRGLPVWLDSGDGAIVTDMGGNEYVDFICGGGANTLGYNHPGIVNLITQNISNPTTELSARAVEAKVAQALSLMIPGAEGVRFFKSASYAKMIAVQLATHTTNKKNVFIAGGDRLQEKSFPEAFGRLGVESDCIQHMPLHNYTDEQRLLRQVRDAAEGLAAVVFVVPCDRELTQGFIQSLRQLCKTHNIMFILDESITGFRLTVGGAQEYFGVEADLAIFSKGIAAGMQLAAITGSEALIVELDTLELPAGCEAETVSLAACDLALCEYQGPHYIEHISSMGRILRCCVNAASDELGTPLRVIGYDSMPMFQFSTDLIKQAQYTLPFLEALAQRGVVLRAGINFISGAHTGAQIDQTISAIRESLAFMSEKKVFS